jgi:predicted GNAT family acetyltransferase
MPRGLLNDTPNVGLIEQMNNTYTSGGWGGLYDAYAPSKDTVRGFFSDAMDNPDDTRKSFFENTIGVDVSDPSMSDIGLGALFAGTVGRKGKAAKGLLRNIMGDIVDPDTGTPFKTGKPATFPYIRNTTPSPDMGETYGQHIEPAGRYMIARPKSSKGGEGFEMGDATFENPLVIEGDGLGWKKTVSDAYDGKTGKELSQAIVDDGYDGIVTLAGSNKNRYTSEIVDLSPFVNKEPSASSRIVRGDPERVAGFPDANREITYTDPTSGGEFTVMAPGAHRDASVMGTQVPEDHQGKGIGTALLNRALEDFPSMGGQIHSPAALKNAYKAGRRPYGSPDASYEEVVSMFNEQGGSINMLTKAKKGELGVNPASLLALGTGAGLLSDDN